MRSNSGNWADQQRFKLLSISQLRKSVKSAHSRQAITAIRSFGGEPNYTETHGGTHWGDSIYLDPAGEPLLPWLFSQHLSDPIPEPTTAVLMGMGLLLIVCSAAYRERQPV